MYVYYIYNKPTLSVYGFKKYINKKYNHNLKFIETEQSIHIYRNYCVSFSDKIAQNISKFNVRKRQQYHYSRKTYRYVCLKCIIEVNLYIYSKFVARKSHKRYGFKARDGIFHIRPYKCAEYMIKGILE